MTIYRCQVCGEQYAVGVPCRCCDTDDDDLILDLGDDTATEPESESNETASS